MLELIIGIACMAGLFAYLYAHTPPESSSFRFLFLCLTMFSMSLLAFNMIDASTLTMVTKYDNNMTLTGYEQSNTTLSQPMQDTMSVWLTVMLYVTMTVIMVLIVIMIYNILAFLINESDEKNHKNFESNYEEM
jgi:hypothetical protein